MRAPAHRAVLAALVVLMLWLAAGAGRARSDDDSPGFVEPPPEQPEGTDYELEPADSLAAGEFELGLGASGRAGSKPRQTRRVRFSDGGVGGSVREGAGDALAGGSLEAEVLAGRAGTGRLAPRWGRGLLLGAAATPWSTLADDRGSGAAYRGRAGHGAWYEVGEDAGLDLMCGRFARRELAGARARVAGVGLGALADRGGRGQASLSLVRGTVGHELALDRAGRWRAEAAMARSFGALALAARARGGLAGFRSLAEPGRSGPARLLSLELRRRSGRTRVHAQAALWRFRPGRDGARVALEVRRGFHQHEAIAFGLEERHGTHRETGRIPGFRQGGWAEWRGVARGIALALRHEALGAERLGRAAVRTVTAVRLELEGPAGSALRITHCAYRVRSGESLYLVENASDRVILRAVSGNGRHTRLEVRAPGAGGRVCGSLELSETVGRRGSVAAQPRWTVDWTRSARSR